MCETCETQNYPIIYYIRFAHMTDISKLYLTDLGYGEKWCYDQIIII